jgi:hypothetical protein
LVGRSVVLVSSSPAAKLRQPALIDQRSPAGLSQMPASTDDVIINTVIGKNGQCDRSATALGRRETGGAVLNYRHLTSA